MCENEQINGVTRNGGYAEYIYLRSEAAVPIPTSIDPAEAAPLLCAGVTVFNSLRKQGITPGDTVAIQAQFRLCAGTFRPVCEASRSRILCQWC